MERKSKRHDCSYPAETFCNGILSLVAYILHTMVCRQCPAVSFHAQYCFQYCSSYHCDARIALWNAKAFSSYRISLLVLLIYDSTFQLLYTEQKANV